MNRSEVTWHDIGYTFRKLWEGWGSSEGLNQIFTHPSVNASNSSGEPYCPHVQLCWYTPLVIFSHFTFPISSASISSPHLQNRNLRLTAVKIRGLHNTWKNYSTCWPRDRDFIKRRCFTLQLNNVSILTQSYLQYILSQITLVCFPWKTVKETLDWQWHDFE